MSGAESRARELSFGTRMSPIGRKMASGGRLEVWACKAELRELISDYYIRALVREAGARPGLVRRVRREARDGGWAQVWCPPRDEEGALAPLGTWPCRPL